MELYQILLSGLFSILAVLISIYFTSKVKMEQDNFNLELQKKIKEVERKAKLRLIADEINLTKKEKAVNSISAAVSKVRFIALKISKETWQQEDKSKFQTSVDSMIDTINSHRLYIPGNIRRNLFELHELLLWLKVESKPTEISRIKDLIKNHLFNLDDQLSKAIKNIDS